MPHDSRHPPCRLSVRLGEGVDVYLTPAVAPVTEPGKVTVILGMLPSGTPLTLTVTSLEWLRDLGTAILDAYAAGVVEADMKLAVAL